MPAASPQRLVPVGVRIPDETLAALRTTGVAPSAIIRRLAEGFVAHGFRDGPLPELMGVTEAAATLGTTTSNLSKIVGLPEPLYGPKHPDPRYRLRAGSLYDAERIRALAAERRARAAATEGE